MHGHSIFLRVRRRIENESVMSLRLNHHCPMDKLQAACVVALWSKDGCMIHSFDSFIQLQLSLAKKVAFLCLCENTCMLHRPFVPLRPTATDLSKPSNEDKWFNIHSTIESIHPNSYSYSCIYPYIQCTALHSKRTAYPQSTIHYPQSTIKNQYNDLCVPNLQTLWVPLTFHPSLDHPIRLDQCPM